MGTLGEIMEIERIIHVLIRNSYDQLFRKKLHEYDNSKPYKMKAGSLANVCVYLIKAVSKSEMYFEIEIQYLPYIKENNTTCHMLSQYLMFDDGERMQPKFLFFYVRDVDRNGRIVRKSFSTPDLTTDRGKDVYFRELDHFFKLI